MSDAINDDTRLTTRVDTREDLDEDEFFSDGDGKETMVTRADLEAAVPNSEKPNLTELNRYWVNKPYAFVIIFRNEKEQELRYYAIEPRLSPIEEELVNFFKDKLRLTIEYGNVSANADSGQKAEVLKEETLKLMRLYNLVDKKTATADGGSVFQWFKQWLASLLESRASKQSVESEESADPVPAPRDEDGRVRQLTDKQWKKILYYLKRDFISYGKIDPIKHDINVEDISVDGYHSPAFVYHTEHEQVITNIRFGENDLDNFVTKIAQNAGKGISKRQPNVDATLEDGSRAQLSLGTETGEKGTNFTIRQFKDVPFTPIDLINWNTYSLNQMVYLWMAIESGKSMVVAGGTASGKTTALNALALFMPSQSKIVSIEDTRELEIPQRNWVADETRSSFQEDGAGEITAYELLRDALRKRPDYIIMGEVRGEESQTLFQAMHTGHTVYTTFHASSVQELITRFTTDPINVENASFSAVDLVSIQRQSRIGGQKVRRNTSLTELHEYDSQTQDFIGTTTFSWDAQTDEFLSRDAKNSPLMDEIKQERGWNTIEFETEWKQRKILLAYLIRHEISAYSKVAAAIQAYMSAPETVMTLIADDELRDRVGNLRSMRNVEIDVDKAKEDKVPRPSPSAELREKASQIVDGAQDLLKQFDDVDLDSSLADYEQHTTSTGGITSTTTTTDASTAAASLGVNQSSAIDSNGVSTNGDHSNGQDGTAESTDATDAENGLGEIFPAGDDDDTDEGEADTEPQEASDGDTQNEDPFENLAGETGNGQEPTKDSGE